MAKAPLIVAGIIFALIALAHLARLFFHFPLVIFNFPVPLWANIIALIAFALLAFWMFWAASNYL